MIIIIATKYCNSALVATHRAGGALRRLQISGAIWSGRRSPRGTSRVIQALRADRGLLDSNGAASYSTYYVETTTYILSNLPIIN